MMDRVYIKSLAKEQIKGNIGILFVITVIFLGITTLACFIPFIGGFAASFILAPAFELSLIIIFLDLTKGIRPIVSKVFDGFYDLWSIVKVYLFIALFTSLWGLLFIIPGIIKGYSYMMAPYILAENKGMGALEAIRRSKKMMHGHKMDLFVLQLSFIGWELLAYITFGLAYIWCFPYFRATLANFYNEIKKESLPFTQEAPIDIQ